MCVNEGAKVGLVATLTSVRSAEEQEFVLNRTNSLKSWLGLRQERGKQSLVSFS